jgi:hypothetical protein
VEERWGRGKMEEGKRCGERRERDGKGGRGRKGGRRWIKKEEGRKKGKE